MPRDKLAVIIIIIVLYSGGKLCSCIKTNVIPLLYIWRKKTMCESATCQHMLYSLLHMASYFMCSIVNLIIIFLHIIFFCYLYKHLYDETAQKRRWYTDCLLLTCSSVFVLKKINNGTVCSEYACDYINNITFFWNMHCWSNHGFLPRLVILQVKTNSKSRPFNQQPAMYPYRSCIIVVFVWALVSSLLQVTKSNGNNVIIIIAMRKTVLCFDYLPVPLALIALFMCLFDYEIIIFIG